MQNSRSTQRKIKMFLNQLINNIKFKIEAFSFSKIIILMWVIIGYISIFIPWIKTNTIDLWWNIFNEITYYSWVIISIILTIILFLLFSYNKKEKLKKSTNIIFRDYIIIVFLSIILFLLAINNLWVIAWLQTFSSEIKYWSWIIMLFISSIFLLAWAILLKNEQASTSIYINDSREERNNKSENNTKLPI